MPRYSMFRGARFYRPYFNTMRKYRRVSTIRRMQRPIANFGFFPGTRGSYRRVAGVRRYPNFGTIRRTYTIPEKKFIDVRGVNGVLDETPGYLLINGLTQGASAITRIGSRIMMKSVHLKYYVKGPELASVTGVTLQNMVRIILAYDLQPNSATPTSSDFFEDATPGLGIVSPMRKEWSSRWKVLWDKRYPIVSTYQPSGITPGQNMIYDETFIKLNHAVEYSDSSTGTVADIKTGAVWLIALSDNGTTGNQPVFTYWSRIRFADN
ncbi:capsid [uncultured virus]|uniref:Capsid n=1 Tax=uncultured virus TaxID=340016 RepID=A0A2K9LW47_9VIRU|nr:capsid [uncultured virus]